MAYTAPTVRSTGELITASIWNVDLVANIAYFKNAPVFDGIITANGFGTNSFSSGGAGTNRVEVVNTTSGATNSASLRLTAGTANVFLFAYSQGYTPGTSDLASGSELLCTTAGGISIRASAGVVRIYGTATLAATFAAAGVTIPGTLDVTGNFAVNTNKFNVTAASGNTTIAGTLGVTSSSTALELATSGINGVTAQSGAFGAGGVTGPTVSIGRNSSGGGAAGFITMTDKAGTQYSLWVDAAGKLRISTAPPQEDGTPSDTSGTVVGTQT